MKGVTELKLKLDYLKADAEWHDLVGMEMGAFGQAYFNRLNGWKLQRAVMLSQKKRDIKKELRKEVGIWKYIKWLLSN